MKGFLIVLSVVYSVKAWQELIGPIHIVTGMGSVPQKYYPLTADDKHATRKAGAFISFIKNVPQLNPFVFASLGPYTVNLPEVKFEGDLHLTNVVVKGVKSLSLSGLEVRMNPARIDFNASLPFIAADVDFTASGVLDGKSLNVNGHVSVNLQNVLAMIAVAPTIGFNGPNQVYQVENADVVINLSQADLTMQMDRHAGEFRAIALEFLNNTNKYSLVTEDILRTVMQAISHELKQITANDILQYLLGSAKPALPAGSAFRKSGYYY